MEWKEGKRGGGVLRIPDGMECGVDEVLTMFYFLPIIVCHCYFLGMANDDVLLAEHLEK